MKTRTGNIRAAIITLGVVILLLVGPAMAAPDDASAKTKVQLALEGVPSDLLMIDGKPATQEQLKAALPASKAYDNAGAVIAEEKEITINGKTEQVEIYRLRSDPEKSWWYGAVLWTALAAFLVFFMQAGFAMVEAGFTRAKNAVNIIMKNVMDFSIGVIAFFLVGFHLMFAGDGESLFLLGKTSGGDWGFTFWMFQAVFCATAATIVSGAMAGRTKFISYLAYSAVISAVIYPIFGSWAWGGLLDGGGWLEGMSAPFCDFAGSTVVHSIGGWLALAGALMLGPRIGKYGPDGKPRAIMGHNIPLASLGVFILWFGWFGFNPGSTLGISGGNTNSAAMVAINTNLSAAAGALSAMAMIWLFVGKPDLGMTMNGCLAGLVAITAPCAAVTPGASLVIGAVGGVIVVLGTLLLDRIRVDDPVGAFPVHGMNGIWGTLSVGLFATEGGLFYGGGAGLLGVQALGTFAVAGFVMVSMGLVFAAIKYTVGLRVSKEEELRGLDITEHGMEAYAGFQIFSTT